MRVGISGTVYPIGAYCGGGAAVAPPAQEADWRVDRVGSMAGPIAEPGVGRRQQGAGLEVLTARPGWEQAAVDSFDEISRTLAARYREFWPTLQEF